MRKFRRRFFRFRESPRRTVARVVSLAVVFAGSAGAQQKLEPVKVAAEAPPDYKTVGLRGFEERRLKGSGKYIAEKELRAADNRTMPNVLTKVPGIRLLYNGANTYVVASRTASTNGRGALLGGGTSPCFVAVYQDGMRLYSGTAGEPPIDFQRLQVKEYAAIEYYAGGSSVPQEFNQTKGSDCGTLLLWTRER